MTRSRSRRYCVRQSRGSSGYLRPRVSALNWAYGARLFGSNCSSTSRLRGRLRIRHAERETEQPGRAVHRIEKTEMLWQIRGAVLVFHRAPDSALDFFGLAAEHRRLIRNADGLQMDVRVKTRRVSAFELFQKRLLVAAIQNVVADAIRLGEIINDQVMAGAVRGGLRGCGLRFLVLGFAVNDAGHRILRVLADP